MVLIESATDENFSVFPRVNVWPHFPEGFLTFCHLAVHL